MADSLLGGATLNFKDKTLVIPSAIIVVSLVVLVAALIVGVAVPLPSTNGVAKSPELQLKDLNHQITMLQTQEQTAGQTIATRTWQGSQNDVSAAILANLTAQAKLEGLAVGSFRPQRTTDLNGVTELPYAVQITGPYPGVRLMMRSLDSLNSKVVLRSAQITAATNSTTDVAATLGLSAYVATDPLILAAAATAKANAAAAGKGASASTKAGAQKRPITTTKTLITPAQPTKGAAHGSLH